MISLGSEVGEIVNQEWNVPGGRRAVVSNKNAGVEVKKIAFFIVC